MEKQDDSAGYRYFGYLLHFFLLHVKHTQNRKKPIIFVWHIVIIKVSFSLSDKSVTETLYKKHTISIMKLLFVLKSRKLDLRKKFDW